MRLVGSCWRRWTTFLGERERGTSLALFRIGVGLTVLVNVGSIVLTGIAPAIWLDARDGGYRTLPEPPWLMQLVGGVTPLTLWCLIAVTLASGLALTLGLCGRLSAFVLLQAYLALNGINDDVAGCDDQLIGNALWLLVLSRATATLSLSCRLRTGQWTSTELVPAWPRYLAVYQIVLVYWATALNKMGLTWTPLGHYAALYYILQEPFFQSADMRWLAWVYPLTQAATALTWLWEFSAPLLLLALWYRRTADRPGRLRALFNAVNVRRWYVLVGLGIHLGIWLAMGLKAFSGISCAFYFCFYAAHEWDRGPAMRTAQPGRMPSWLLGGLISAHLAAITLASLPFSLPEGTEQDRDEYAVWVDVLAVLGIETTPLELEDNLMVLGRRLVRAQEVLIAPFEPYYRYCGTAQGWPMFSGSGTEAFRIAVDVDEGGSWRTVYEQRSRLHVWLRGQLEHEHLRWGFFRRLTAGDPRDAENLARWLAVRAGRDFPAAEHVRLRVYRFAIPSPQEVREDREPRGKDAIVAVAAVKR